MPLAELFDVMNEISHDRSYRLDQPNRSSWIGNTYEKSRAQPKSAAMQTPSFNFDSVLRALDREIERKGVARTNLALAISKSNKSLLNNIFDGSDIKLSTLTKIADHLEINVARLIPWAGPDPYIDAPSEAEVAAMIRRAVDELEGASFEDYPQAVASSVHAQLKQYLAAGGLRHEVGEIAPDTDAPPPKPTKPRGRAKPHNP